MPAAANLLQRAVALQPAHDRDRLALMPDLGYALFEVGRLEPATRILSETTELARAAGEHGVAWHASMKLAHARMYTDPGAADPERLARTCRRAIAELERLDDQAGLARAWSLAVDVAWARGRMAEAAEAAERAAVHARAAHSPRDEAWGLGASAFARLLGPTPVPDAIRRTARQLDEASGNTILESNLTGFLAALEAMSGRFDAARVLVGESRDRLHDLGLTWQGAVQEHLSGQIELLAGDAIRAEGHFRTALDAFARIGDRWFALTTAVDLARALLEQRRHADARAAVAAIPDLRGGADREVEIKRHGIEARLLAAEGRVDAAVRRARAGVTAAERTDLVWFHADALTDLADVLGAAGRRAEAVAAARAALALHELKHNVASARRVRLER
jgi:hypothetical protein